MTFMGKVLGSATLTALVIATSALTPAVGTMRAGSHVDHLWVDLRTQSPAVPTATDSIVLSGEVVNGTSQTVTNVAVQLRVSPTPVRSRAEIPMILSGDAGRTGVVVPNSMVTFDAPLLPGARQHFAITAPIAELGLPLQTSAVIVIGVEAIADTPGDGLGPIEQDFARSFIPWFPVPGAVAPTRVVWLFPLSSAPSRLRENIFLDDHLAREFGSGGRLSRLLNVAAAAPTSLSWVVDPALLEAAADMADGYEVQDAAKKLTPGAGEAAAVVWLSRLRQLTAAAEVTASPYGNPDVVALHRAGLDVDIALATTTAANLPAQILGRGVARGLAWPPNGVTDDGTLDVMRASGSRAIVLSGTHLVSDPSLSYTPSGSVDLVNGVSPLRAVVGDPQLSYLSTSAPTQQDQNFGGIAAQAQQFLAELAMSALELPTDSRTLVIAPPVNWTPAASAAVMITSVSSSAFSRPATLSELLANPPSDVARQRLDYSATDAAAELSPGYLRQVANARSDLALIRSVAPDTSGHSSANNEEALTRAESAAWRNQLGTGQRLVRSTQSSIDDEIEKIRILSHAPITLPGDQGVIPITIANDLDRPARVGVRLTSTPSIRFHADDVPTVTLEPGQKQTLEVTARVAGTGPVLVNIGLLTPDGQPIGEPVSTQVRSAAYSHAAQWVVIAFFAALVLLMVRGAMARRKSERGRPA